MIAKLIAGGCALALAGFLETAQSAWRAERYAGCECSQATHARTDAADGRPFVFRASVPLPVLEDHGYASLASRSGDTRWRVALAWASGRVGLLVTATPSSASD